MTSLLTAVANGRDVLLLLYESVSEMAEAALVRTSEAPPEMAIYVKNRLIARFFDDSAEYIELAEL